MTFVDLTRKREYMNQKQYELLACAALDYLNSGDTLAQVAKRAGTYSSNLARFIRDQRIDAKEFNQTLFDRLTRIKNKEILFERKERQTHDESVKIQLVLEYLKTNEYAHTIAVRNNISNKSSIHTWKNYYFSYYNAKYNAELIDVLENKLLELYSDCIKNTKTDDISNYDLKTLREKYIDELQKKQMLLDREQEVMNFAYNKESELIRLIQALEDVLQEFKNY